jgi:putative oxidoreductase
MKKFFVSIRPYSIDFALLILRIVSGAAMLTHGWPKLQKMVNGNFNFGDPIGIGSGVSLGLTVFAEVVCSIFLIIGFATRGALIPLIITMGVALFIVHSHDGFNKQEMALLYLGIFISLFLTGPGKFSVDKNL